MIFISNCRSNVCPISGRYDCHHLCQSICCFNFNTYFGFEATQAITSTDEKNIEDESVENALSEEEHHISLEESLSRATSFEKVYVKTFRASIVRPWLTIASAVMIAVVTVVLLSQLGSDFLPKDDLGQLAFTVELPVGSTMDDQLQWKSICQHPSKTTRG